MRWLRMTTVLCFGTFDGLHPGHEDYFRQAREIGERVVVVVARDETVIAVKGHTPRIHEAHRVSMVHDHALVHEARLGYPGDKYQIIEEIHPDIILLGYDQQAFVDRLISAVQERGLVVDIRRAKPYHPEVYKSSKLYA